MEVAVLGAGRAGEAVGARCVRAGHRVRLRGEDANAVMDAVDGIERAVGAEGAADVDATTDLEAAVGSADLVVDATGGDDVGTTRGLLADVEEEVPDEAVIATGTPTLSVTAVAAGLRRPGRSIGLHFVDTDGPLVEVVLADQTTSAARDRAISFVESLGCTPIVARDAPGFLTPRLDAVLVAEAVRLVDEGVASVRDVDRAMAVGRGHPSGPLVLADEIGLDAVLATMEDLADRLDGRFAPPPLLREKVADGALGKPSGRGFYVWEGGDPTEPAAPDPTVESRDERTGPADR